MKSGCRRVKRSLAASFRHFFAVQKCSYGIAFISFRLSRIFAKKMAEREGFEPSVPFGTPHFQCGAFDHSTISPLRYKHKIHPDLLFFKLFFKFSRLFVILFRKFRGISASHLSLTCTTTDISDCACGVYRRQIPFLQALPESRFRGSVCSVLPGSRTHANRIRY